MRHLTLAASLCTLTFLGCGSNDSSADKDEFQAPVLKAPAKPKGAEPTASELLDQLGVTGPQRAQRTQVSGGKIRKLDLSGTDVKDLSPLSKLSSLTFLNLALAPVKDLSPLKGLPLEELILLQTKVKDLSPLKGMELKLLDLTKTPVDDLSPLEGMQLEQLYLEGTGVTDLTPLKGMPLTHLNLLDTKVESIEAVADLSLHTLWIPGTNVSSLEPLRGKSLTSLDIARSKVTSLEPISQMTSLQRLNLEDAPVTDLTPLKGLKLQRLIFTPSKIEKGIDAVRNMPSLTQLGTDSKANFRELPGPAEFWAKYDAGEFK